MPAPLTPTCKEERYNYIDMINHSSSTVRTNPSSNSGLVFDVRRFSTHDGDGIRTTVFLKGCPLRCAWCQNPEGLTGVIQPVYFKKNCIRCKTCAALSRHGGINIKNEAIVLNPTARENWQLLTDACPSGALRMDSQYEPPAELFDVLMKDVVFFQHGGGVTFSGGEPLMQAAFLQEILVRLKDAGVHTAIESSLYTKPETLTAVLPFLDCVYADFKIADDTKHRLATGCGNRPIKENLSRLLTGPHQSKVIVRTPLIPGFTDSPDNIAAISDFLYSLCPSVAYELLNFNPLAQDKYRLTGRNYAFKENPPCFTNDQMSAFADIARSRGLHHVLTDSPF